MTIEDVILQSLYEFEYDENDIDSYSDTDYFLTYNPLNEDINTKSCMIFKENGNMKLLNGFFVDPVSKKETTSITLSSWLRCIGIMRFYIKYVFFHNNISMKLLDGYADYLFELLTKTNIPNKKFEDIRRILYKNYILDIDVLGIDLSKPIVNNSKKKQKLEAKSSTMNIVECTPYEELAIYNYLNKRGLSKLTVSKMKEIIYPVTILVNDLYRNPSVCLDYGDTYKKYRMIFALEKKFRFKTQGTYKSFYPTRISYSDTIYLVEGELESLSLLDFIEEDIVALHNTNSLPSELGWLNRYKNIIVKIDNDCYDANKSGLYKKLKETLPMCNITVDYKTNLVGEDYNTLLVKKLLTTELIKKINYKEEVNDKHKRY